ncbi:MAG: flavodoxin-dependent (E)-4-hydroxy-3-methylbut-2-enyl-diphosphate synthase [Candidatus Aminicenantes bacterium]|nr:flavodoxin-dependent (E)-4-hydroxy-3-methylbut-2-enyl-diphosphate synthase [Candidatus Aminicenantes bacterium]
MVNSMVNKSPFQLPRRQSKPIKIGQVIVGGGAPIVVQSMTKTKTKDITSTIQQIQSLARVGCEIVRVAIPDKETAISLKKICQESPLPIIADIHFDYRLALAAIEAGANGLRINPGTIGSKEKIKIIVREARERGIPIRIGLNSGSLEKSILKKYGRPTAEALVESALNCVHFFEDLGFDLIKISLKASDVLTTLQAYRLMAEKVDYPFHVGITEAGPLLIGSVKSAVGCGLLIYEGLADTLRVSLTAPPEEEVRVAYLILSSLNLRKKGIELISCPTCGRIQVDLLRLVAQVEKELSRLEVPLKVALMGCMVNGPGEAREADIGLACGRGQAVIFKRGRVWKKIKEEAMIPIFIEEVHKLAKKKEERS